MRINAVIAVLVVLLASFNAWGQYNAPFSPIPGAARGPLPLQPTPIMGSPGTLPNVAPGFSPLPNQGAFLSGNVQPLDPYSLPSNLRGLPPAPGGLTGGLPGVNSPIIPPSFPPGTLAAPSSGLSPNWQPPGSIPGATLPGTIAPNAVGGGGLVPGGLLSPGGLPRGAVSPGGLPATNAAPYGQPTARSRPSGWAIGEPFGGTQNRDPFYRGPNGQNGSARTANAGTRSGAYPYQRLFQDTGLRGTYLHGDGDDGLGLTEAEASTTAYFANFLGIPNGLRVTPGFAFHWTDGPFTTGGPADIPPRLYSGYLDFGLNPRFSPQFGAELTARVGIYSDFQAFNDDAIRILGSAVGIFQTTPDVALKLGAVYIDRLEVKLLPAIGFLWTPNPYTYWDVFFPAPKLSNYWTTIGNSQVWWYIGGEYGGGSWSIETEAGVEARMDINDIRLFIGAEWWDANRYFGFAEVGYVFQREIAFDRFPGLDIDDTFMVRGGVSW